MPGSTRLRRLLRTPAGWVFALAGAALLLTYCSNDLRGKPPYGTPGDGRYHPQMARGDGHMLFLMTRSIVFDRDLDFDNDLARFGDPWNQPRTRTGQKDVPHPIGPALVWAPILVVAHGLSKVANLFGAGIPGHGYTMFHQRVVFLSSPVLALMAALFGFLIARRWVGGRWAPLYGVVAALFGTSLLYYATYMPAYGHAMDAGFVAAFLGLWALRIGELGWRRFVWLGVLLGVCGLIRTQDLAFGIVVAVEVVWLAVAPARERRPGREIVLLFARGAVVLGVALAVFTIQLAAWKITTGDWFHAQNGPRYVRFAHPQVLELLFASRNGWFSTTPLAYAAVIGLFLMPRRARLVQVGLLAAVLSQVYLNSCIMDWWGQAAFGQRRLCSVTAPLVVGMAALLRLAGIGAARLWRDRRRLGTRIAHGVAIVAMAWFLIWNWAWVNMYRHGRAAGFGTGAPPWQGLAGFQRAIARPIYRVVGNPFMFPADAWFAWRHDVPMSRWAAVVGDYVWDPPHDQYDDGRYRRHKTRWGVARPGGDRFVVRGLGKAQKDGARWSRAVTGGDATTLVPILLPEVHRFTLAVQGAALVRWNGEQVGASPGPAWNDVTWDADVGVGMNELTVDGAPGATRVGDLIVGFPPAPPP
jgi:hypothetical protein